MRSTIYLDPEDGIASIRSKLEASEGDVVIISAPKGLELLENPLHLRLILRHANRLGKEALLVSGDRRIRGLARQEGFQVYSSLKRFGRGESGELKAAREISKAGSFGGTIARGGILLILLFGLMALLLAGWYLYPSATVVLKPTSEIVSQTMSITATTKVGAVGYETAQIPARSVEVVIETSGSVEASGKRFEPEKPATGQVAFINKTGEKVVVPKDIEVSTTVGVKFRTISEVTVPPVVGGSAIVDVIAVEPGTKGNVDKQTINQIWSGQLPFQLSVVNEKATQGGTDMEVKQVTLEDQKRLRDKVTETVRLEGHRQLLARKKPTESIYPETVKAQMLDESFDKRPGEVSPILGLKLRMRVSGLVFDGRDVNELASKLLLLRVKGPSQLIEGTLRTRPLDAYAWEDDWLSFRLFIQGAVMPLFDRQGIQSELAGMSEDEAKAYVARNLALAEPPQIKLEPGWAKGMPRFAWRIKVEVSTPSEERR